MLICPNCSHNLTPITVKPDPSSSLELDHCYYCGGVWFDHYEINRIKIDQAKRLAEHKKSTDQKYTSTNLCPRDSTKLIQKTGESIPQNVLVSSCPTCGGNFVTIKDLVQLKKAQKIRLDYFKTWNIPLPALSSILIPLFLFSVAIGAVFITVRNVEKTQEARIKAEEIISTPTIVVTSQESVLVSFTTTVPVNSTIVYKAEYESEPITTPVSLENNTNHLISLNNLKPNTTYTLKIYIDENGEVISSPTYSFKTN